MSGYKENYARGVALVVAAGLVWSTGGMLVRLIDEAASGTIAFWRAASMGAAVLLVVMLRHRGRVVAPFRAVGWLGPVGGFLIAGASTCFVFALGLTTVSNVLFLQSASPFIAAVLGWALLKERIGGGTWLAICLATAGVTIMVFDGLQQAGLLGNVLGVLTGVFFALYTVALRSGRQIDMLPVLCYMSLWAMGAALIMAPTLAISTHDLLICVLLGAGQLALGSALYVMGSRHVPASQIILLTLLEVVLGPVWAWIAVGEVPTALSLAGGAVVICAVLIQAALARRAGETVGVAAVATTPD